MSAEEEEAVQAELAELEREAAVRPLRLTESDSPADWHPSYSLGSRPRRRHSRCHYPQRQRRSPEPPKRFQQRVRPSILHGHSSLISNVRRRGSSHQGGASGSGRITGSNIWQGARLVRETSLLGCMGCSAVVYASTVLDHLVKDAVKREARIELHSPSPCYAFYAGHKSHGPRRTRRIFHSE